MICVPSTFEVHLIWFGTEDCEIRVWRFGPSKRAGEVLFPQMRVFFAVASLLSVSYSRHDPGAPHVQRRASSSQNSSSYDDFFENMGFGKKVVLIK